MKPNRSIRRHFETLERQQLLSATTIESEPNNSKAAADFVAFDPSDLAAEVRGAIGSRDDRDFFRFNAPASGPMDISVQNLAGVRAKVTVEGNLGNKLFESEPNDGIDAGSFNVTAGQRIFVRVRGIDKTVGDYLVHLQMSGGPATASLGGAVGLAETGGVFVERESNDRPTSANPFRLDGGDAQLMGTSQSSRDKDFFVFTAEATGRLSVAVTTTSGRDARRQVEDRAGNKLFETEPNDGINEGAFDVVAGTTYFVRLRSPDKAPSSYLVDLAFS
jgi:hypothetical protein